MGAGAISISSKIRVGSADMPGRTRRVTVEVPAELLSRALRATGAGVAQTIRAGLELIAAGGACERLLQLQGKVQFSRSLNELKADR